MKLSGVGMRYGGRVVLRNVSLEIAPGAVTLLVGPNGAGKSTLLRIMAGLIRPSAGTVEPTFEGRTSGPASQGSHGPHGSHDSGGSGGSRGSGRKSGGGSGVGYLGHATFVYPGLSALENLAFWSDVHGLDAGMDALTAALARVGLARYARERAGGFSRGMAQRLNLARVLLLEPDLLLLDEPGTGLDQTSLTMLRREIALARTRGAGVVWISHDVAADAALADRIVALADRGVAFDGAPADYTGLAAPTADNAARSRTW